MTNGKLSQFWVIPSIALAAVLVVASCGRQTTTLNGPLSEVKAAETNPPSGVGRQVTEEAGKALKMAGLRDVSPLTDCILVLHFVDGKGFPDTVAGGGSNGHVAAIPLDVNKAAQPRQYQITSRDDPIYANAVHPDKVGRKSKGRDFVNDHGKTSWVIEHWIYLVLPQPMQHGKTYLVSVGDLSSNVKELPITFDETKARSDAIHVNEIGYVPTAPQKFAYLSAWMGDLGPLVLDDYQHTQFHLLNAKTDQVVFSGQPTLRKKFNEPDGGQPNEGPNNNYTGADVWQLDFSAFKTPGTYVIAVDRIGASYPFQIAPDIYRQAFLTTVRGLYHQRCGIELKEPYTKWVRPACHRPETKPFLQTTHRNMDGSYSDGNPNAMKETTGEKRLVWGGWHDAGDWDRESWHLGAANTLLLAYELAPQHFKDGEQNIPESGNGIPDIIDEAKWCIDYYTRLQRPDGGVSVGFFESSYPKGGQTSWHDPMDWFLYAEEPLQSYRYAASACHLAWCLKMAGKPQLAAPYIESARKAWVWAGQNMRPGDEAKVRDERLHAAASLYRVTGEAQYQDAFKRDCTVDTPQTMISEWGKREQQWGVWTYVLADWPNIDKDLKNRLTEATFHFAQVDYVDTAEKRAGRYAYNWYVPLYYGAATTPKTLPLMMAYHLSGDSKFLATQYTTCDYMLGGNPMNMVWVTGLGPNHPHQVMHWDSWYGTQPEPIPGIVPMGPYRYEDKNSGGPWAPDYAQKTAYPTAKTWPPHELWFEDRLCPPTNEFTVGSMAEAAAAYGFLCADEK
ncbi:MAG: glycoside hydrolase family 9 protein [Abitibacteriaceae bacterium]|nr:glycoside hydrolase family 9 protein [Abditibacteriaceae bacterium]